MTSLPPFFYNFPQSESSNILTLIFAKTRFEGEFWRSWVWKSAVWYPWNFPPSSPSYSFLISNPIPHLSCLALSNLPIWTWGIFILTPKLNPFPLYNAWRYYSSHPELPVYSLGSSTNTLGSHSKGRRFHHYLFSWHNDGIYLEVYLRHKFRAASYLHL